MENFTLPCKSNPLIPIIPSKPDRPATKPTLTFSNKPRQNPPPLLQNLHLLCKTGHLADAVAVLDSIAQTGSKLPAATYMNLLQSCIDSNSIHLGRKLHRVIHAVDDVSPFVETKLVSMYAKCGCLEDARKVFDEMRERNLYTWSAMIGACLREPYSLAKMVNEGIEALCSISEEYQIIPGPEHYSAIVDLYGRSGRLQEAMEFIEDMPIEPDSCVWAALLTACRNHGNLSLAIHAGERLIDLEPGNVLIQQFVLQAYDLSGKPDDTSKLRRLGKENATIKRSLGQCWMLVNNTVHTFISGDRSKLCSKYVNSWLQDIAEKANGPDFRCGLVVEQEEEGISMVHCEKLALAFALIGSQSVPKSIRIVKDLRMCGDCHRTAKYISMAFGCDIYLSDSKSLHHFSNGRCSCGDYW